jgi:sugar-specific transcriptional regulator TrmB
MAQRARDVKDKGKAAAHRSGAALEASDAGIRVAALEAERDRLKERLAEAEARIAELERTRTAVVNRIDWIIDSLTSTVEKRI